MLLRFLRRLLAIGSSPRGDETRLTDASTPELESFERLLTDLTSRVPDDLRDTFQHAIRSFRERPATGPELIDALDRVRMGLGVAIGRGQAGEDQRYEQLGRLVAWLYGTLGRPQNTRFAVAVRAANELKASEPRRGEA